MYILDTNTLIYFFKGIGNVSKRLLEEPPKNIGLPAIVVFELQVGISKSASSKKKQAQLKNFTSMVNILPFGVDEARDAAIVRVALEKKGTPIGPYDVLIAGTVLSNKGVLVTHNTNEFARIKGLRIEDWY